MSEFMEGLRDMCEAARRADRMDGLPDAIQKNINDQITQLQKSIQFSSLGELKISFENDKSKMTCGTKEVDPTKLQNAIEKGDVGAVFRELGADSKVFKTPEYKEYEKNTRSQIENSDYFKENKIQEDINKNKDAFDKKFGQIKTGEDFKNLYDQNKSFKNYVDDIVKKSDEDVNEKAKEGKTAERGSWTKTKAILLIGAAGLGLDLLIKTLQDHANEMSGCFLKDTSINGQATKCKVKSLTCKTDDIDACTDKCQSCKEPITGCKNTKAEQVNCFDTTGNPDGTCIQYASDTCNKYLQSICSSDSEVCNTCTCDVQSCPPKTELECKKADIGDAFVDYFNQFIDLAESILKKVLYYGVIVLIIGLVIFIFVKFFGWLMNRRRSSKVIAIST